MQLRWALTIVYVVVLVFAFVVQIFDPAISALVFWGVFAWFIASLFLYRLPAMSRPVGLGRTPRPAAGPSSMPPRTPPVDLGFCVRCGTHLPEGSSECPQCGRPVVPV